MRMRRAKTRSSMAAACASARAGIRHSVAVCVMCMLSWNAAVADKQDARTAQIVGLGATTCRQFAADVATDPQVLRDYLAWAQGFMSGIVLSRPPGVDAGLNLNPPTFGVMAQLRFLPRAMRAERGAQLLHSRRGALQAAPAGRQDLMQGYEMTGTDTVE